MKNTVAFYFIWMGITLVVGCFVGQWEGWEEWASPCVVSGVLLLLAAGMLRGLRVARIASVGVCTFVSISALAFVVFLGLFLFLTIVAAFGIPLIGLLHPRCRRECNRTLRSTESREK